MRALRPRPCSDWSFLVPFLEEALGLVQEREGQPHAAAGKSPLAPALQGPVLQRGTEGRAGTWLHGEGSGHGAMGLDGTSKQGEPGVGEGLGGPQPPPLLPAQVLESRGQQTAGSREEPLARQGELESGEQQKTTKDVGSQHGSTVSRNFKRKKNTPHFIFSISS